MTAAAVPVPAVRSVLFSAFRSGRFAAVRLRPSRRAASGVVAACGFSSPAPAAAFASYWARRLGRSVVCRPVAGFWVVSVPVAGAVPLQVSPAWWVRGGLRGLDRIARAASIELL